MIKQPWGSVTEVGAARVFHLVISLVVVFLTARILGPEQQGIIAASIGWVTLYANMAGLSLGQVVQYRLQLKNHPSWLSQVCGSLLVMLLVLSALACLAAVGLYSITDGLIFRNIEPEVFFLSFSMLPLIIAENYLSNVLAALDRLRLYNLSQYIGRGLWLIMTTVFLMGFGMNVLGAIAAQLIGQAAVVAIGATVLLTNRSVSPVFSFEEIKGLLSGSARLHLNTISSFVLGYSGVLFLNNYCSSSEVAWFQMANQMMLAVLVLPQAASIVFFSEIAKVGPDRFWPQQKKMLVRMIVVIVIFSITAFAAAPVAIPILAGDRFLPVVEIFQTLLPCLIGLSIAQLLTAQWISRGLLFRTSILTTAAAMLNIALNYLWIPRYGILGAAWVSLLTYAGFTLIVQLVFVWWCNNISKQIIRESQAPLSRS